MKARVLLTPCLMAVSLSVLVCVQARSPKDLDALTWVWTNHGQIREMVLPLADIDGPPLPPDMWWYVSVQIMPDNGADEVATLIVYSEERIVGRIKRAVGGGLMAEIARLHAAHPDADAREVARVVHTTELEASSAACKGLTELASRFKRTSIHPWPDAGSKFHATWYRFRVVHQGGYILEGEIEGSIGLGQEQAEPIAAWTAELRGLINECASPQAANN